MATRILGLVLAFFVAVDATTVAAQSCAGDCDGDGTVTVNEPVIAVEIALGKQPLDECTDADANGDGSVGIDDLVASVTSAVQGCQPDGGGIPLAFLGEEFMVNTFTENFQDRAAVAAADSGDFIVTWESFGVDGISFGVAAQRFAASGDRLGAEFVVNSYVTDAQRFPGVAVDEAEHALVAWRTDATANDPEEQAFVAQVYDADGQPVGGEVELASFAGLNADVRLEAGARGGGFVIVSDQFNGDYADIFGQLMDGDGQLVGGSFMVNTHTASAQFRPSVAGRAGHGFVVVWQSLNQDGSDVGVFGQRFDDDGQFLGEEFQVSAYTQGRQADPSVAMDGSGRFVVTWITTGGGPQNAGVAVQRFAADGSRVGTEFRADTPLVSQSAYPVVAADPEGSFLVVWQSRGQKGEATAFGIFARQFTSAGAAVGEEFQVNTFTPNSQSFPAVAADGEGRFVVVWTSSGQDGDVGAAGGIFGQRFEPGA